MEIKYVKRVARLLKRTCVNRKGLGLSKEALQISVDQRAAELPAVKFGGQKNFCRAARFEFASPGLGRSAEFFFKTPTLMAGSFASF